MLIALFFVLGFAILAAVFAISSFVFLLRDRIPYVASPAWVIDWLAANIQLQPGSTIVELGCGDARVLRAIVKASPGIRAIGYERNWWPYLFARWRSPAPYGAGQSRGGSVEIHRADFYKADLQMADVVYGYLLVDVMLRVEALLRSKLKPGARFYSYAFRLPNWEPEETIQNPTKPSGSKLFVYRA